MNRFTPHIDSALSTDKPGQGPLYSRERALEIVFLRDPARTPQKEHKLPHAHVDYRRGYSVSVGGPRAHERA